MKYVMTSSNRVRRILWLMLVLFGIGFMLYQVQERIRYYLTRPTSVDVNISVQKTIPFPTVTVCNENILHKTSVLEAGGEDLLTVLQAIAPTYDWLHQTPNFTLIRDMLDQKKSDPNFWKELYQNATATPLHGSLFLDKCQYGNKECDFDDWEYVTTDIGVCIQFNGPNAKTKHTAAVPGHRAGLSLLLYINTEEYTIQSSNGAGVRVLLHERNDFPAIDSSGAAVFGGTVNSLQMTYESVEMLPKPYGNCSDRNNYYQSYCLLQCEARYINNICSCQHLYMPLGGVRYCDPEELYNCGLAAHDRFLTDTEAITSCDCPVSCRQTKYSYSLTTQEFTERAVTDITNFYLQRACTVGSPLYNTSECGGYDFTKSWIGENAIELRIFFPSFLTESVKTKAAYNILALLCDIGGALGLVLGSTILTIFEFADFFVMAGVRFGMRTAAAKRGKVQVLAKEPGQSRY